VPKVKRSRTIDAPPPDIWRVISDPHHLPRWWPGVDRVEEVDGMRWTKVFGTSSGKSIRADFTRVAAEEPRRYCWRQELEASPFERILSDSSTEIALEPADGGTRVQLTTAQKLRGLSRFGFLMVRRATGRQLDEALSGLERATAG